MRPKHLPPDNARCGLTREAIRHTRILLALLLSPATLPAQPASIVTHNIPTRGVTLFDASGNTYITGTSNGQTPVTPGAAQTQPGGGFCVTLSFSVPCSDAYILKTDPAGNVIFGTLLGGPTNDDGNALAVDAGGNVFIVGSTSGSFPTTANAALASSTTSYAFAAKLSADGSRFLYSTYLPSAAAASSIAIDAQGNAYVAGQAASNHAFVTKISPDGSALLYNVTLAGSGVDSATSIAVDNSGNAYVTGWTTSRDFPVSANVMQPHLTGARNAFVAKLGPAGSTIFATYLGGSGLDAGAQIQLDSAFNIYVAGSTSSTDFPTTASSFEPEPLVPLWNNRGPGGFLTKLSPDGRTLAYSSYAMTLDTPLALNVLLSVAPSGDAYLAGSAGAGIPVTPSAPQICFGGASDAFVFHITPNGALADATYVGGPMDDYVLGLGIAPDGSLQLAWWSQGNEVVSQFHFADAGSPAAPCLSPDALNSATMHSSAGAISPGEFVTLTGFGIGPNTAAPAGIQVLFDNRPAPLLYAQLRQINVQAPIEIAGQPSTNITVQYNHATIGSITVPVLFGVPGLFRLQPGGSTQAAALNQDGTVNGPTNPAARGSVVALFGTGFGSTSPACPTGGPNVQGPANLAAGLTAQLDDSVDTGGIGGHENPAYYAGSAPGLPCGVDQINMTVPDYAGPGIFLFTPFVQLTTTTQGGIDRSGIGSTVGASIFVK